MDNLPMRCYINDFRNKQLLLLNVAILLANERPNSSVNVNGISRLIDGCLLSLTSFRFKNFYFGSTDKRS